MLKTDWTKYYESKPPVFGITRKITTNRIINALRPQLRKRAISICELGGAGSCALDPLSDAFEIKGYQIADSNAYGLNLVDCNSAKGFEIDCTLTDVLVDYDDTVYFDVVFSIGLIEHFDVEGTKQAISGHFQRAGENGVVLITYPTPTVIYRVIRKTAELLKKWRFVDERPLIYEEVQSSVPNTHELVSKSKNWWIGLTQEMVVFAPKNNRDFKPNG